MFLLWYGPVVQFLFPLWNGRPLVLHAIALPSWAAILLLLAIWAVRSRRDFRGLSRYLNMSFALLLVFPLVILLKPRDDVGYARLPLETASVSTTPASRPDIYFIILDKYTGSRSLAANFDYDNEPFEDSLRQRGFFVPERSRTNYVHTHLSLASMLNWSHLQPVAEKMGSGSRDRSMTYGMIEDNRAWRFLKAQGYRFIFFPSAHSSTSRNDFALRQIPEPSGARIHLGVVWIAQTPFAPIVTWICMLLDCMDPNRRFPYQPETAEDMESKFRHLMQQTRNPGPQFVLVHILLPHEPYIFNADCTHRHPVWPAGGKKGQEAVVKQGYIAQIVCLNRVLLGIVDHLMTESATPPVIVLQSDHGHGRMVLDPATNKAIPGNELPDEKVFERVDIFAAYYLPNGGNEMLYDSITPVNVFPVILNHYFAAGIPLNEDATFWSDSWRPFRFRRVRLERTSNRHE